MTDFHCRDLVADDIDALEVVLEETGLFTPSLLAPMSAAFIAGDGDDLWLTLISGDAPSGLAYLAQEAMADRVWNLRAIAVAPALQGRGGGRAIISAAEARLRERGGRLLIVDTSGLPAFEGARAFYPALGFRAEGVIRDFWAEGDDKVSFAKTL
ncbi:MAG: GNAT family N-acetyltransferase [Pseudomonadota bacterium]